MPGTPPNANSLPPPGGVRSTPFLRLWASSTASGLATWALPFVLGLAVLEGALTAIQLGLVLAARTTGFLAAMPVSGVLAGRFARRGDRADARRLPGDAGSGAGVSGPLTSVGGLASGNNLCASLNDPAMVTCRASVRISPRECRRNEGRALQISFIGALQFARRPAIKPDQTNIIGHHPSIMPPPRVRVSPPDRRRRPLPRTPPMRWRAR